MAQVTITIPDDKIPLLKDALGYAATLYNEDGSSYSNPETASKYVERILINYLKERVRSHEKDFILKQASYTELDIS